MGPPSPATEKKEKKEKERQREGGSQNGCATCSAKIYVLAIKLKNGLMEIPPDFINYSDLYQ